jgi:hypothetical protein
MHIGWRKLGNLQQTRSYVTGRNLWGAITARLTREQGSNEYKAISNLVDRELTFTYFYPSVSPDPEKVSLWPWDTDEFSWAFLGSYASTALENSRNAEEGSLHETEFIAPYARNTIQNSEPLPVYLVGYIFARDDSKLAWREALSKLQIGGERSYGWGRVSLEGIKPEATKCFDDYHYDGTGNHPLIVVPSSKKLLAHTNADVKSHGSIEPFIGRETRDSGRFGKHLAEPNICWAPGSTIFEEKTFQIMPRGLWREVKAYSSS